jgi:hypothetical protein
VNAFGGYIYIVYIPLTFLASAAISGIGNRGWGIETFCLMALGGCFLNNIIIWSKKTISLKT